jgi:hypothetical protein
MLMTEDLAKGCGVHDMQDDLEQKLHFSQDVSAPFPLFQS